MSGSELNLRPVTPADQNFLLRVYASSRAAEMAMVPWTPEQKDAFLRSQFEAQTHDYSARNPDAEHNIIIFSGKEVGRLFVARRPGEIHILDLTVLSEARGTGAGSALVRRLQEEAASARLPLTIYVETFNPALNFFAKRGFRAEKEEGIHVLMRWMPGS